MKKLIIILLIFASCKQDYQGYRIQNSSGSVMYLTTTDGNYTFNISETKRIVTSGKIEKNNISFENPELIPILFDLGTHPDKTLNIMAYKNSFEVYVFGNAKSVDITINGIRYIKELPFYYGDNSATKYRVTSKPINNNGYTYTYIMKDGKTVERYEHYYDDNGVLTGDF